MPEYIRPTIEEIGGELGSLAALRRESEQQQQQQQQQQAKRQVRRFLEEGTDLPQEEVVTSLTTEIKTLNKLAPRKS